jgi:N-methylhydantoinase A
VRLAVDTGGTFTDLVVEDDEGALRFFKSPTTPDDPIEGVLAVLTTAADELGFSRRRLLQQSDLFIHGTTRAINAILTNNTAQTALLTTKGHPDILLYREGGRSDPFNWTNEYPDPYIPASLTFEIPERLAADGTVVTPLDSSAAHATISELRELDIEAVAVCFLWSIINPEHELQVGSLLEQHLPGVPFTLSHQLNPVLREYRRASSTAIDASLKPLMREYLSRMEGTLREEGFAGRALVVTSAGGVLDAADIAEAPIHSIGSGPAMAPVAGRHYAKSEAEIDTAVIADAGGTSYDVSLVRRGDIPWTRETWIGRRFFGHITGFPSVDVRSIGAGGGSIAWVDEGGLLRVGPQSAGAMPGPACYGHGGKNPTVTDASLILGYIDPTYFLGGSLPLNREAATAAVEEEICSPLRLDRYEAAAAILRLATENMVRAIEDITLNQGIDPRAAALVAGGGASGLNAVAIARRLGTPLVVIPDVAGVLSAAGGLISDLTADFSSTLITSTVDFNYSGVTRALRALTEKCMAFAAESGFDRSDYDIDYFAEARYQHQLWELEVPLRKAHFAEAADVEALRTDFDSAHEAVYAIKDRDSAVDVLNWRARVRCRLRESTEIRAVGVPPPGGVEPHQSSVYFPESGFCDALICHFDAMVPGEPLNGPAVVQSAITTVVLDPGATATRTTRGTMLIRPSIDHADAKTLSRSARVEAA